MKKTISISEIISYVPKPDSQFHIPKYDTSVVQKRKISINQDSIPFYVEPDFLEEEVDESQSQYCALISAPAAVGKTTFAKYLLSKLSGNDRQVLYIPLKDEKIGDNYFIGLLGKIYPDSNKNEILELIVSGKIILLFDGYDEVSMTNSQIEHNKLFIGEIVSELSSLKYPIKGVVIFFLFRSMFYEFGIFESIIQFSRKVQLEFFCQEKRKDFLVKYLAHAYKKNNTKNIVSDLLDAFSERLKVANTEAESFFGHAIVLEAFGDYIFTQEEHNLQILANDMAEEGFSEVQSVGILVKIIKTILDREVGKFNTDFYSYKLPQFSPYDADTQEQLLSSLAFDIATHNPKHTSLQAKIVAVANCKIVDCPDIITLEISDKDEMSRNYIVELTRKIDHHPFINPEVNGDKGFRNPVYFEYYLAKYFSGHTEIRMDTVFSKYKNPSYFFAMFFLSFIKDRNITQYEDSLYYLSSLYRSSTVDEEKLIRINYLDGSKIWEISFEDKLKIQSFYYDDDILQIFIPSERIFPYFEITGKDKDVIICGKENDQYDAFFSLVDGKIECNILEMVGTNINFDLLFVESNEIIFNDNIARLTGVDSLFVENEECKIQMSESLKNRYFSEIEIWNYSNYISDKTIIQKVKRIILYFRKHGRSDFACYGVKYNSRVLNKGKDQIAKRISDAFHDVGLIKNLEGLKILNPVKLEDIGISYVKQNEINITADGLEKVRKML
ncbi:MAG: hypothetical protein WCI11_08900 [Candidatus Methylumidiphilus sp.]